MQENKRAISKKNIIEMSADRDFISSPNVVMRYCILSIGRSGSSLLSRMLYETKLAGDPIEYFHAKIFELGKIKFKCPDMSILEFLEKMQKYRTSPNGIFGMKIPFNQLSGIFDNNGDNMIHFITSNFQKFIWIRRKDMVAQAVSMAIALKSNQWSLEKNDTAVDIMVNNDECMNALRIIRRQDEEWVNFMKISSIEPLVIWYEDFVMTYEKTSKEVIRYLGLESEVLTIPDMPLKKQSNENSEKIYKKFKTYLAS
jgi:LPS sulfotransferase NodH